jgi:hypothetical protein
MDLSTLYSYQSPGSRVLKSFRPANSTMSHTAFFYGTLMAPPVLHRVIWGSQTPPTPTHASLLRIRPAILHAHQRHKVKHADYPAILPTSTPSTVRGTLVEGLTDGDIWRLDIFEGSEYERRKVEVRVLDGEGTGDLSQPEEKNVEGAGFEAETYIWIAGAQRLEAEEWDFSEFVRDKMKRWVGKEGAEADEGFQGRPSINGACKARMRIELTSSIDVDDAVAALDDPTGGRGANGNISRQLQNGGKSEAKALESAV